MHQNETDYVTHRPGDKVRISKGDYKGQKGAIQGTANETVEVMLTGGEVITLPSEQITNFSLAARKAWQTMRAS